METIQFYFISNQYFIDFPDEKLMRNKSPVDWVKARPYFYAFKDNLNPNIYWMVPISSKCEKYKKIQKRNINKYGYCDTIIIGAVLGEERAFLIQSMCPVTAQYLKPYYDQSKESVYIVHDLSELIRINARSVLKKASRGIKLIYPDVVHIYHQLEIYLNER